MKLGSLFDIPTTKPVLNAPLADKSPWHHIRLAIKPRYLWNHVSQIKSYYGSLSWSYCRSFRIHHEKSPEAPLGSEIMITSYLAHIRLALKPCYLGNHAYRIKSYYGTQSGSHGRSFRVRHEKVHDDFIFITCSAVMLRTALIPYGNLETSTPHSCETSQVVTMKPCTFDYVRETNTCAKFGWNPPARGRSTHTWNIHFLWLLHAFLPFLFLAHLHRPYR